MKSSPAATFVMSQPQFLLELFVVSLDDPTMLGCFYQLSECGIGGEGGKPILGWLTLRGRPFDQEPFFYMRFLPAFIAMGRSHAQRHKSRAKSLLGSPTPRYRLPMLGCQGLRQLLHGNWSMLPVSTESRAGAPPPFLLFGGQREFSRFPDGRMFPNADNVT